MQVRCLLGCNKHDSYTIFAVRNKGVFVALCARSAVATARCLFALRPVLLLRRPRHRLREVREARSSR